MIRIGRPLLLLLVPGILLLPGCGSLGDKKGDDPDLPPPPRLRGSADRPVDHLPPTEFPFDDEGNYVVAWAQEGDKKFRPITRPSRSLFSRSSSSSSRSTRSTSSSTRKKPATRYHTVGSGDTLWALSRRYGKSVSSIKSANGLRSDTIRTGQRLKIP